MTTPKRPPRHNADGTITIFLTQGQETVIDAIHAHLAQKNWRGLWDSNTNGFYAIRDQWFPGKGRKARKTVRLHREIMEYTLDRVLRSDEQVDHNDHCTLNNQLWNLELVSNEQNQWNRSRAKNNTSGFIGVSWNKKAKKWRASIQNKGRTLHLGYFDDPIKAAAHRDAVAIRFRGVKAVVTAPLSLRISQRY